MGDKNGVRVIQSTRKVLERKLLTALNDETRVAILATCEDLDLLILALGDSTRQRARQYAEDLKKLRDAAFPTLP